MNNATTSTDFIEITTPITSVYFHSIVGDIVDSGEYLTYKVFAKIDGVRKEIHRICKPDPYGILYIGQGSRRRFFTMVSSITSDKSVHHFGLKYRQLLDYSTRSFAELGDLYVEVRVFENATDAIKCEGIEQLKYRQEYGENPPYCGRWEGE